MLQVYLMGAPYIVLDGSVVKGFESVKALAVFAYLVQRAHPVSRQHLAGLFWGHKDESLAHSNLRRVLHNLNLLFPDLITSDRNTLYVPSERVDFLDTREIEACSVEDEAERCAAVLRLCRSEFCEGLLVDDSPEFSEWLEGERRCYAQKAFELAYNLAHRYLLKGDLQHAIHCAEQAIRFDRYRDSAYKLLMRLLYTSGDRSAALQRYQDYALLLKLEIGASPSEELTNFYHRLLTSPPRWEVLPEPASSFVGRAAELEQVRHAFLHQQQRLITLLGMGGAGKTRLAIQAGKQLAHLRLDGVAMVSLEGVSSCAAALQRIAQMLIPTFGGKSLEQQLARFFEQREILIILDGAEGVLSRDPDRNLFRQALALWLKQAPDVWVILTSRVASGLHAEQVLSIGGLGQAVGDSLEAIDLLLQRLASLQVVLDDAQIPVAEKLCRQVGGLPFAIELLADQIARHGLERTAEQLRTDLSSIRSDAPDLDEAHRSLGQLVQSVWDALTDAHQRGVSMLSLLEDEVELPLALYVSHLRSTDLALLTDAAVVQMDTLNRLSLHPLLRSHIQQRLKQQPRLRIDFEASVIARVSRWAAQLLPSLYDREQNQAVFRLVDALPHLMRAWQMALQAGAEDALFDLMRPLYVLFDRRMMFRYGEQLFDEAATHVKSAPLRASLRARQAMLLTRRGQYAESAQMLDAAAQTLQPHDKQEYWFVRSQQAYALALYGDFSSAIGILHDLQEQLDLEAPAWLAGDTLNFLGIAYEVAEEYDKAEQALRAALDTFHAIGHLRGIAFSTNNLGIIMEMTERYTEALHLYQQSADSFLQINDHFGLVLPLSNLGDLHCTLEQFSQAARYYQEALMIALNHQSLSQVCLLLSRVALLLDQLQHRADAWLLCQEVLRCTKATDAQTRGICERITNRAKVSVPESEPVREDWLRSLTNLSHYAAQRLHRLLE